MGTDNHCENFDSVSGTDGLELCQRKCRDHANCNLINFCLAESTCNTERSVGTNVNRCCMRTCESADPKLVSNDNSNKNWAGWDVYTLDFPATTDAPTNIPTNVPTNAPSDSPTAAPTNAPTSAPTDATTDAPTNAPTKLGSCKYHSQCNSGEKCKGLWNVDKMCRKRN